MRKSFPGYICVRAGGLSGCSRARFGSSGAHQGQSAAMPGMSRAPSHQQSFSCFVCSDDQIVGKLFLFRSFSMLTAIECSTGISRRDYCSDSSISICSIPQLSVLLPLFPRNFPLQGKCSSPAVCPAREQLTQCRSHSLQSLSLIKNLVDISRKYCSLWKCFPFSPHSYINHLGLVLVMLGCLFS